jgi:RNA polymerase sigma-70 factor (ECF subfamily)
VIRKLEREEDKMLLMTALDNLDQKYREILILKFLENKDYTEISDILEKPMGSVATLINRGKKQLKKEVDKINLKQYD